MKCAGSCHCGAITFDCEVDPERVMICHCTDCQTLSGTVYRTILPVPEADFTLLSGEPKVYVKTGDSGNRRQQTFCPACGSPIYACPDAPGPKTLNLRVGALKERDRLVPKLQLWARSAQSWVGLEDIPKMDKQRY